MTRDPGPWDAARSTVPEAEQIEYLRQVLAIPSAGGEEGPLARFVASRMQAMGIGTELGPASPTGRAVVARIPGAGRGPSLMLLAHLDVPAMASGWTRDPVPRRPSPAAASTAPACAT